MSQKQETLMDLFLAEFFSVVVGLGLYLFLANQIDETWAIVGTCIILFLVTLQAIRKSSGTLALASFVAVVVLMVAGLSGTYMGAGGMRPVIFTIGLGYFTLTSFPILMIGIGLKFRWSALSLFAEGLLVWAGLSHLPNVL